MNAEKLMKETYPTIEFEDKWDYLTQRFSADDMIHFAELYAQKQANGDEQGGATAILPHVTASLDANHLKDKGYKQYGYWWVKDGISVNLMAGTIKSEEVPCLHFRFTHDVKITKVVFNKVEMMLQLLLNWR